MGKNGKTKDSNFSEKIILSVKGLSKAFGGQVVLNDISLELKPGKIVLLRGENGSGKTTLLNILTGNLEPDSGELYINIYDRRETFVFPKPWWRELNPFYFTPERLVWEGIGRLWQDIRLFPTMTALENVLVATPGSFRQNPLKALAAWPLFIRHERESRERAIYQLSAVGMEERANSSGDKLSLGQMKRVALARLLQSGASLLLLDEPLAGLDKESAIAFLKTLEMLRTKENKTLLIVEHQHEKVAGLCDEIWYLSDGKLTFNGVQS